MKLEFWGRQNELLAISRYLLSETPRCCAIIGEDTFGKTSLLQHLSNAQEVQAAEPLAVHSYMYEVKEEICICLPQLRRLW